MPQANHAVPSARGRDHLAISRENRAIGARFDPTQTGGELFSCSRVPESDFTFPAIFLRHVQGSAGRGQDLATWTERYPQKFKLVGPLHSQPVAGDVPNAQYGTLRGSQ